MLFFACCVNPYSNPAQSLSGVGVGSKEMHSVLVDGGQLLAINEMLTDLKIKLGYVTSCVICPNILTFALQEQGDGEPEGP